MAVHFLQPWIAKASFSFIHCKNYGSFAYFKVYILSRYDVSLLFVVCAVCMSTNNASQICKGDLWVCANHHQTRLELFCSNKKGIYMLNNFLEQSCLQRREIWGKMYITCSLKLWSVRYFLFVSGESFKLFQGLSSVHITQV